MDVAIIGLPQSGKTSVFNALIGGHASASGGEAQVGVVKVADPRVDVLAAMYARKKTVHAEIRYWDPTGSESAAKPGGIGGKYRNVLQGADAFLLVIGVFTNPTAPHPLGNSDPGAELESVLGDLALADLEVLERAVDRLQDGIRKSKQAERPALVSQMDAVKKAKQGLEEGLPLRRQRLTNSESGYLTDYQLLSGKPVIVAFNTDESGPEVSLAQLALSGEATTGLASVSLCGKLEADLGSMSSLEADEFRRELGLGESAVSQVVKGCYEASGLVSFLTVGDQEVRAWSVPAGMPAVQAAGTIHSDFQRGFIRAEVIPFDDLVRCGGIPEGRKEGLVRSEGKTYGVADGDVINFLINV